ncbi:NAD(P)-dependent alcohol dehydrogenase [Microbacterium halotolerans]|uniref:NAD(P)-dependent alcohol dehydrogenase n=1 Tax=Microbacterium halotolerans TaxID=246613 RepID=UPI000E6A9A6D|nr:NAD(P)-dependent alcohol dehydrogenase [Microbacterium halotolerans]
MRAIEQVRYGGPDVLNEVEREVPVAGGGEVVVRVRAAAVDAGTVHLLEGRPVFIRWFFPIRRPRVPGGDVAGIVHEVGAGVDGVAVGDEVFGVAAAPDGALAEFCRVEAAQLAPKPEELSFVEAAAMPISGATALHAVRDAAGVSPGGRVLVLGAGGGVGHFAVQIAKATGAVVVAACSAGKAEIAREAGADEVVDYRAEDPLGRGPFDAIIDTGGHRPVKALRAALRRSGALVIVGSEPEHAPLGGLSRSLGAALLNPFTSQRLVMLSSSESAQDLRDLTELVRTGRLRPIVHREYVLADTADALATLGRGEGAAKTVVSVA